MSSPFDQYDASAPDPRGATAAQPEQRQPAAPGEVRPAEQIEGAHDTYDKGEVSSIGAILGAVAGDVSTLMQQEVALAKAEIRQSAQNAGKGAGMLAGAGVAGHLALIFLSIALWWGLGSWMDNFGVAALIVGILWAVIAAALAAKGRSELKQVNGVPRTMETAKKVPDALKGNEDHR